MPEAEVRMRKTWKLENDRVKDSVKAFYNKNRYLIWLVLIVFFQCLVIFYWANQKNIGFVDEYFTLEGSAQGGFALQYWDTHGEFYGLEHPGGLIY